MMERLLAGVTPGAELATVIDSETGEAIAGIVSADAVANKVVRRVIRDGSYAVENGDFVCIEEDRAIRIVMPAIDEAAALARAEEGQGRRGQCEGRGGVQSIEADRAAPPRDADLGRTPHALRVTCPQAGQGGSFGTDRARPRR